MGDGSVSPAPAAGGRDGNKAAVGISGNSPRAASAGRGSDAASQQPAGRPPANVELVPGNRSLLGVSRERIDEQLAYIREGAEADARA
eukprot:4225507-Heterocapsa_arctica.AAC.1